jgi:cytochrome d ubiquinol oxidase subunit I
MLSAVDLARLQFAFTAAFHFIFPAVTIGLGFVVALAETFRWRTRSEVWDRLAKFWTKVFALTFAVGVATGIVMEFQFGTNWSRYATFVGDIFGSPLAAEAILAFFLESTFLGVLLWGGARVGSTLRWFSAVMVSFGAALSGLWIIIANSWMQTPAGYEVQGDRAVLTDFWAAAFNPSTLPRYLHTISSALAVGSFLVVGVAAWYLLKGRHYDVARRSLKLGLIVAIVASIGMFLTGDTSSRQVANTQPVKFAAMNGLFETGEGVPMIIFAFPPGDDGPSDLPSLAVPNLLSLLTTFDVNGEIQGLDAFPTDVWPPVASTFSTYHLMVGLGALMLLVMVVGVFGWMRGRLERWRWWLAAAVVVTPAPLLAVQLGWATAEIGRQPWIVYGVMRTADGVSPIVSSFDVAVSLLMFGVIYVALAALWLFLLRRVLMAGPAPGEDGETPEALPPAAPAIREPKPVEVALP